MLIRLPYIRHERAGQAGFSLVEAMIALAIFTIGVLGAYKMQIQSIHSNAMGERVSTATNWAVYEIEELIGRDYNDPDFDDDGVGAAGTAGLDDLEANADGAIYVRPDGSKSTTAAVPPETDIYSVSWNIAEGKAAGDGVLRGVKLVRVHVVRKGGIGSGELYSHDYFKTEEF